MSKRTLMMALCALTLALAVFGAATIAVLQGSDASSAATGSTSSAGTSTSAKTTPAACWDAYGADEQQLADVLSKSIWKSTERSTSAPSMTLSGTEASIVRSGSTSTKAFGLKDVSRQELAADGETIARTTAKAVASDGTEYDLTIDEGQSGSTLTCALFGSSAWVSGGTAGDCQVGTVPEALDSLIAGNGEKMRTAVAKYITESIPTATAASCSSTVTCDTSKNMVYVTWSVTAAGTVTLSADCNLSTGDVTVAKLEA